MKILALETSAVAVSAAVCEDGKLLAQSFQDSGLTHSRTLMPMVRDMLKNSDLTLADMDVIAAAVGPGSFTGLRIGIAAAKGLAWAAEKPCAAVSTLKAMAWQVAHMDGIIVPVMDARRHQYYNALFEGGSGEPVRRTEDRAIGTEELLEELRREKKRKILVGDGAHLCYTDCERAGIDAVMAPPQLLFQSAWGVAREALELAERGELVTGAELEPRYHRLSQAERERMEKERAGAQIKGE